MSIVWQLILCSTWASKD